MRMRLINDADYMGHGEKHRGSIVDLILSYFCTKVLPVVRVRGQCSSKSVRDGKSEDEEAAKRCQ